jgi:hypothetical protein
MKVDHAKFDAISFWLVYSSNIFVIDALARAYTLGITDKYQNATLLLRGNILQAFREYQSLPKPTSDDMELSSDKLLPSDLVRFLSMVMSGKEDMETSEKMKRLVYSIGQDKCRAGKMKVTKTHASLCDCQALVP